MTRAVMRLPRDAHIWLPGYLRWRWRCRSRRPPARVWVTFADHFEPFWRRADEETARRRVELWRRKWPEIAARHCDSAGRPPKYTFFYPQEEYRPRLLDSLAEMVEAGIADVEVHIHHDGEGQQNFVDRISAFIETLYHRHGLLRKHNGKIAFGFVHGNWALDNSHPDGRWCGLNNELTLLRDLGCYADFTLPSAPSPTQTRMVNTIYWAMDDPQRPKSHDTGVPVTPGGLVAGDLMIIPGPLGLNWSTRKRGLLPTLETGELAAYAPPSLDRARLWLRLAPRVGEDVFIKLFAHGAQEKNSNLLLGGGLKLALASLQRLCADSGCDLYFLSAWETWRVVNLRRQNKDFFGALAGVHESVLAPSELTRSH